MKNFKNKRQLGLIHVFLLVLFLLGVTTFGVINLQSRLFEIKTQVERITPAALREAKKGLIEYADGYPDMPPRFYSLAKIKPKYNFFNHNIIDDLNDDRFIVSRPGQLPCPDNVETRNATAYPGTGATPGVGINPEALIDISDRNLDGVSDPGASLCSEYLEHIGSSWFLNGSFAGRYPYADYFDFISYIRGSGTGDIFDGNRDRLLYVGANNVLDVSQAINPYHINSAPTEQWLAFRQVTPTGNRLTATVPDLNYTNLAALVISPGVYNSRFNSNNPRYSETVLNSSFNTPLNTIPIASVTIGKYLEGQNARQNGRGLIANIGPNISPHDEQIIPIHKDELLSNFDDFANIEELDNIADSLASFYKKNNYFPDPATFDKMHADIITRQGIRPSFPTMANELSTWHFQKFLYEPNDIRTNIGVFGMRDVNDLTYPLAMRSAKVDYFQPPLISNIFNNVNFTARDNRITGVIFADAVGQVYLPESTIPSRSNIRGAIPIVPGIGFATPLFGAEMLNELIKDFSVNNTGRRSRFEFSFDAPPGSLFRTAKPMYITLALDSIPTSYNLNVSIIAPPAYYKHPSAEDSHGVNVIFPDLRYSRLQQLSRLGYAAYLPAGSIIKSLGQVIVSGENYKLTDGVPAREFTYNVSAVNGFSFGVINDLRSTLGLALPSQTPIIPGHQGLLPTPLFPGQLPTLARNVFGEAQGSSGLYNQNTVPLGEIRNIQRDVDDVILVTDPAGAIGYFPGRVTLAPVRQEQNTYTHSNQFAGEVKVRYKVEDSRIPYYYPNPNLLNDDSVKIAPRFAIIGPIELAEGSKILYGQGAVIPLGHAWSHSVNARAFNRVTINSRATYSQMGGQVMGAPITSFHPSQFHTRTILVAPGSVLTRVQLYDNQAFHPEDSDLFYSDNTAGYAKAGPITIQKGGYIIFDQLLHYNNGSSALQPLNPVQANFRIESEGMHILSTTHLVAATYNPRQNLTKDNIRDAFAKNRLSNIDSRVPYADGFHIYPFKNEYAVVSRRLAPVPSRIDRTQDTTQGEKATTPIAYAHWDARSRTNIPVYSNATTYLDNRGGRAQVHVFKSGQDRETCPRINFSGVETNLVQSFNDEPLSYRYCEQITLRPARNRELMSRKLGGGSADNFSSFALVDEFGLDIVNSGNLTVNQTVNFRNYVANNTNINPLILDFERGVKFQANPGRMYLFGNNSANLSLALNEHGDLLTPLSAPFYPRMRDLVRDRVTINYGIVQTVDARAAEAALHIHPTRTLEPAIYLSGTPVANIGFPSELLDLGSKFYHEKTYLFEFKNDVFAVESDTQLTTFIPEGSIAEYGHLRIPMSNILCRANQCDSMYVKGGRVFSSSSGWYNIPRRSVINSNETLYSLPVSRPVTLGFRYARERGRQWVCFFVIYDTQSNGCPRLWKTALEGFIRESVRTYSFQITFANSLPTELTQNPTPAGVSVPKLNGGRAVLVWDPSHPTRSASADYLNITLHNSRMVIPAGVDVGVSEIDYGDGKVLIDNDIGFIGDGRFPNCTMRSSGTACPTVELNNVYIPPGRELLKRKSCRNAARDKFFGNYLHDPRCYDFARHGFLHTYIHLDRTSQRGWGDFEWNNLAELTYTFMPYGGGKIAYEGGAKPFFPDNFWRQARHEESRYKNTVTKEKVHTIDYISPNQLLRYRFASNQIFWDSHDRSTKMFDPFIQPLIELSWLGKKDDWNYNNFDADSLVFAQNNPMFYAIAPSCRKEVRISHEDCTEDHVGLTVNVLPGHHVRLPEDHVVPAGLVIHGFQGELSQPSEFEVIYSTSNQTYTPATLTIQGLIIRTNGQIDELRPASSNRFQLINPSSPRLNINDGVSLTIVPGHNGIQFRLAEAAAKTIINTFIPDLGRPKIGYLGKITLIQGGYTDGNINRARYDVDINNGDRFRIGAGSKIFTDNNKIAIQFGQVGSYSGPVAANVGRVRVDNLSHTSFGTYMPNFRTKDTNPVSFHYLSSADTVEAGKKFELAYPINASTIVIASSSSSYAGQVSNLPASISINFNQYPGFAWQGYILGDQIKAYAVRNTSSFPSNSTVAVTVFSRTYNTDQPSLASRTGLNLAMPGNFAISNAFLATTKALAATVNVTFEFDACLYCGVYTISYPTAGLPTTGDLVTDVTINTAPQVIAATVEHDGFTYENDIAFISSSEVKVTFAINVTTTTSMRSVSGTNVTTTTRSEYIYDINTGIGYFTTRMVPLTLTSYLTTFITTTTTFRDSDNNITVTIEPSASSLNTVTVDIVTTNDHDVSSPFQSILSLYSTPTVIAGKTYYAGSTEATTHFYTSAHKITTSSAKLLGEFDQATFIVENATPRLVNSFFIDGADGWKIGGPLALVQSPHYANNNPLAILLSSDVDFEYSDQSDPSNIDVSVGVEETYTYVPPTTATILTFEPAPTATMIVTLVNPAATVTTITPTPTLTVTSYLPTRTATITTTKSTNVTSVSPLPGLYPSAQYFFDNDTQLSLDTPDLTMGFVVPSPEFMIGSKGVLGGSMIVPGINKEPTKVFESQVLRFQTAELKLTLGAKGAIVQVVAGAGAGRPVIFNVPSTHTEVLAGSSTAVEKLVDAKYDLYTPHSTAAVQRTFTTVSISGTNVTTSLHFINPQNSVRKVSYRMMDAIVYQNDRDLFDKSNIINNSEAEFLTGINRITVPGRSVLTIINIGGHSSDPNVQFTFPNNSQATYHAPGTLSNTATQTKDISRYKVYRVHHLINAATVAEVATLGTSNITLEVETQTVTDPATSKTFTVSAAELDTSIPGSHPDPAILTNIIYHNVWIRLLDDVSYIDQNSQTRIIPKDSIVNPFYGTFLPPYSLIDNSANDIIVDTVLTAVARATFEASPPVGILPKGITIVTNRKITFHKVKALISYSPRPLSKTYCRIQNRNVEINQLEETIDRYHTVNALSNYNIPDFVSNLHFVNITDSTRNFEHAIKPYQRISVGDADICMLNDVSENTDMDNEFHYSSGNSFNFQFGFFGSNNQMRLIGGRASF